MVFVPVKTTCAVVPVQPLLKPERVTYCPATPVAVAPVTTVPVRLQTEFAVLFGVVPFPVPAARILPYTVGVAVPAVARTILLESVQEDIVVTRDWIVALDPPWIDIVKGVPAAA